MVTCASCGAAVDPEIRVITVDANGTPVGLVAAAQKAREQHAQMLSRLFAEYAAKAAELEAFYRTRRAHLDARWPG